MAAWRLLDPFYLARRGLHAGVSRASGSLQGALLDVGCGIQPYRALFPSCAYVGLEVLQQGRQGSGKQPDAFFNGLDIPVRSGAVDTVLCTQVLEHVFEPARFLAELNRVLRPGGRLLLTVPFLWDEHEQPYDYARYSTFGLRHLLAQAGFDIVTHEKTLTDASVLVQLWLAYIHKVALRWPRPVRQVVRLFVVMPSNVLGRVLQIISPRSHDLFLDHVVLCVRSPDAKLSSAYTMPRP